MCIFSLILCHQLFDASLTVLPSLVNQNSHNTRVLSCFPPSYHAVVFSDSPSDAGAPQNSFSATSFLALHSPWKITSNLGAIRTLSALIIHKSLSSSVPSPGHQASHWASQAGSSMCSSTRPRYRSELYVFYSKPASPLFKRMPPTRNLPVTPEENLPVPSLAHSCPSSTINQSNSVSHQVPFILPCLCVCPGLTQTPLYLTGDSLAADESMSLRHSTSPVASRDEPRCKHMIQAWPITAFLGPLHSEAVLNHREQDSLVSSDAAKT